MKLEICCSRFVPAGRAASLTVISNQRNQRAATLLEFVVAAAILVACFVMVAVIMNAAVKGRAERSFDASDSVVPCQDRLQGGERGLSNNDCF